VWGGEELLRLESREELLDPLPAILAQVFLRRRAREELRHRFKIELVQRSRAEGALQVGGAASGVRIGEIRLQDFRQLDDQAVDDLTETPRALRLGQRPDVADQAPRHGAVAVDDFAVQLEVGARVHEALGESFVVLAKFRGGLVPQDGELAFPAGGGLGADVPFEREDVFPEPFGAAAVGDPVEDAVDQAGERFDAGAVRRSGDQDQREIVAQPGQVMVGGKEGGTQSEPVDRFQVRRIGLPGQEKCNVGLQIGFHSHLIQSLVDPSWSSGPSYRFLAQTLNLRRVLQYIFDRGERGRHGLGTLILAENPGQEAALGEYEHVPLMGSVLTAETRDMERVRLCFEGQQPGEVFRDDLSGRQAMRPQLPRKPVRQGPAENTGIRFVVGPRRIGEGFRLEVE
jgi:hypothetical protein